MGWFGTGGDNRALFRDRCRTIAVTCVPLMANRAGSYVRLQFPPCAFDQFNAIGKPLQVLVERWFGPAHFSQLNFLDDQIFKDRCLILRRRLAYELLDRSEAFTAKFAAQSI